MQYLNKKIKKIIYFFIGIFVITLIIIIIWLLMLKYEVEGENNMPFELSQIIAVSTAEGIGGEGEPPWNFDLIQNNDIDIHIAKNKGYKETEVIKNIIINNFNINTKPAKGNIIMYRPSNNEGKTYEYNENYIIKDSLTFKGEKGTNLKDLTIANQGGMIAFRYSNQDLRKIYFRGNQTRWNNTWKSRNCI